MRHHLPQKVLHSKGGSHKDTLKCTPLLRDTPWGSWCPLPILATMTLRGVIAWTFPTLGTLSTRGGGWNSLKSTPPPPMTQPAFDLPTPGEFRIPCLLLTQAGVEQRLETFPHNFLVATAPRPHHLVPPHLAILCFHNPPKHNVAVPINKVEGGLRGANHVGVSGEIARHPTGGGGREGVRCGGGVHLK